MKTVFLMQFYKDLDKITATPIKNSIADTIENVEIALSPAHITGLKKLKGYRNAYRIKMGDYRIGVFIEGSTVEFARIVHRKDIYKQFP
jgi:mRNA interferase RelE/StbE